MTWKRGLIYQLAGGCAVVAGVAVFVPACTGTTKPTTSVSTQGRSWAQTTPAATPNAGTQHPLLTNPADHQVCTLVGAGVPFTSVQQARTLVDRMWGYYSALQDPILRSAVEEQHQNMLMDRSAYDTPAQADATALSDFNAAQTRIADACTGQ